MITMTPEEREHAQELVGFAGARVPNGPTAGDLAKAHMGMKDDLLLAIHIAVSRHDQLRAFDAAKAQFQGSVETQKAEFDALGELVRAFNDMPPIVDDDYPPCRSVYEGRMNAFIKALRGNGRL